MKVREGVPADMPRLREIQVATLAEPWPALLETAVDGPPPLYVVEDGAVVGYTIVVPDGETVAYAPEFAVHPDTRREGYGTRLLRFLRGKLAAAGYDQLRVTVRVSDDGARGFYAANGFERLERLDDHFEDGDGLLLALALDGPTG
jgi:ribosomal-protein-alanine N-acetyltransferase